MTGRGLRRWIRNFVLAVGTVVLLRLFTAKSPAHHKTDLKESILQTDSWPNVKSEYSVQNDNDVYITRTDSNSLFKNSIECRKLRRPSNHSVKYFNTYWQYHQESAGSIFVISAFYDDRRDVGIVPVLRIISVAMPTKAKLYCQIWYSGSGVAFITEIDIIRSGRGAVINGIRYGQYLFTCSLPSSQPLPSHVSVATSKCGSSTIYLPVYVPVRAPFVHDFGICVAIAHGKLPVHHLVEWFELNNLLGVTEFHVYNGSMSGDLKEVFSYYEHRGLLKLHQMPPPVSDFSKTGTKLSSPASLNDCMLRNMYRFRYMLVLDFDEFFIPRLHSNYKDMLQFIDEQQTGNQRSLSYTFRNAYFFLEFLPDASQPEYLSAMRYRTRLKPSRFLYGSKSLIDPRRCLSVFNHYCFVHFAGDKPNPWTVDVNTSVALSHHYRHCNFKPLSKCMTAMKEGVADDITLRFKPKLHPRVQRSLKHLGQI